MSKKKEAILRPHELASIFPPMGKSEFEKLAESIAQIGQQEAITLLNGEILDGVNRYNACRQLKIEPRFVHHDPEIDPLDFVVMKNMARRNLDPSQLAAIGVELIERWRKTAPEISHPGPKRGDRSEFRPISKVKPREKAAAALNISHDTISKAAKIKKEDPEVFEDVRQGKTTVHAATVKVEAKKNAKVALSDAYKDALIIIRDTAGEELSQYLDKKKSLTPKEVIALAELSKDVMVRIKPLIMAGWKYKATLEYKPLPISYGNTIRQLVEHAQSLGGWCSIEMHDPAFTITAQKKISETLPTA